MRFLQSLAYGLFLLLVLLVIMLGPPTGTLPHDEVGGCDDWFTCGLCECDD